MNQISQMMKNAGDMITPVVQQGQRQLARLGNHSVKLMNLLSKNMHSDTKVAIAVMAQANLICFFATRSLFNRVEARFTDGTKTKNVAWKKVAYTLSKSALLGGAAYAFNIAFSKMTSFGLNPRVLALITATHILGHLVLNTMQKSKQEARCTSLNKPEISSHQQNGNNEINLPQDSETDSDEEDGLGSPTRSPINTPPVSKNQNLDSVKKEERKADESNRTETIETDDERLPKVPVVDFLTKDEGSGIDEDDAEDLGYINSDGTFTQNPLASSEHPHGTVLSTSTKSNEEIQASKNSEDDENFDLPIDNEEKIKNPSLLENENVEDALALLNFFHDVDTVFDDKNDQEGCEESKTFPNLWIAQNKEKLYETFDADFSPVTPFPFLDENEVADSKHLEKKDEDQTKETRYSPFQEESSTPFSLTQQTDLIHEVIPKKSAHSDSSSVESFCSLDENEVADPKHPEKKDEDQTEKTRSSSLTPVLNTSTEITDSTPPPIKNELKPSVNENNSSPQSTSPLRSSVPKEQDLIDKTIDWFKSWEIFK